MERGHAGCTLHALVNAAWLPPHTHPTGISLANVGDAHHGSQFLPDSGADATRRGPHA
jgi:hypothetical protein